MFKHVRLGICLTAAMLVTATPETSADEGRPMTEQDLLSFVWVADPQISADGAHIAFVRVDVDRDRDHYRTAIWVVPTSGREPARPLTAGPRDTAPRWSPDGTRLAFVRAPEEKEGRAERAQIYLLPMRGGEPRAVTTMPRGAANPSWSPDGRTIAFSSTTRPDEIRPAERADDDTQGGTAAQTRESDVRVIAAPAYRANGVSGSGYVERNRPAHVWTVPVPEPGGAPGSPRRITEGEFPASNHQWSPDGRVIYFTSDNRANTAYSPDDSDLYAIDSDDGESRRIASIDGTIGSFTVSADGKRIAFIGASNGSPERSYDQPDLWIVDVKEGTPRNLTASYDFDIGGGLAGDQRAPRGQHPAAPVWGGKSETVFVRAGRQGHALLVAFDVAKGVEVYDGHSMPAEEIVSYTADADAQRFAMIISSPTTIGDLHVADATSGDRPRKLTSFNDALFATLKMNAPEEIWYSSFDGRKIQGWILKPPDFDASKKYPLVVQIHGGPHAAYGNTFTQEFHTLAARGYVVLYTNPRGSSNYGQEFGNAIQFRYPGDDYKDIMAGVDALLEKGYLDEQRMGVTGGSGGGLLTNWVVTQTNRFKAAVSQRDISDWSNFWYTADFTLFTPRWFRKAPFEDPEDFARRSPITYADRIRTPLMFILGDEDWRTPPAAGGEGLFRALLYLKRPTVMVRFPDENHELSRSGKPWHRVERLQHIAGWFDKYLMGKANSMYETVHER